MPRISIGRDQVIAAMLVGAVVVVLGFASGLGLKSPGGTAAAQGGGEPVVPPPAPVQDQPLPESKPPQGVQPPQLDVPVIPPVTGGTPPIEVPSPVLPGPVPEPEPVVPPPHHPPTTPPIPPPGTPPECTPGLLQDLTGTATGVLGGLPVAGDLTGALGLTTAPDGTPGTVDGLLAAVIGQCPDAVLSTAPVPGG